LFWAFCSLLLSWLRSLGNSVSYPNVSVTMQCKGDDYDGETQPPRPCCYGNPPGSQGGACRHHAAVGLEHASDDHLRSAPRLLDADACRLRRQSDVADRGGYWPPAHVTIAAFHAVAYRQHRPGKRLACRGKASGGGRPCSARLCDWPRTPPLA